MILFNDQECTVNDVNLTKKKALTKIFFILKENFNDFSTRREGIPWIEEKGFIKLW